MLGISEPVRGRLGRDPVALRLAASTAATRRVSVETLRVRWQKALDAAQVALRFAALCLPAVEVRERAAELAAERGPVESLLQELARDRHQGTELVRLIPSAPPRTG